MKFLALLTLTFLTHSTLGFTLSTSNAARFPENDIKVDVVGGNTCTTAGFNSASELQSKIQEAVDEYWNRIPTCALELETGSIRSDVDWSSIDISSNSDLSTIIDQPSSGTILVGCGNTGFSSGVLAVALINPTTQNQGVVVINNSDTTFANLSEQEKLATIAHEIGHAFGLGHSSDDSALMYFSIGGKVQEKLSIDDYDGCSYLYPHDAPASCSSIAAIPKSGGKGHGSKRQNPWAFFIGLLSVFILFRAQSFIRK